MKGIIATLLMILSLPAMAQVQKGYVKSLGRPGVKGAALQGVSIRVRGVHNAVVSAQTGTFSIAMTGKKAGDAYALQSVKKAGYELIEAGMIGRNYAFSPSVTMQIVMVNSSQLQADKQRIENNAYKAAEKNYKAKMTALEKQLNAKKITAANYEKQVNDLQKQFEKYESLIEQMAEHYAKTDYDALDEKNKQINQLIENGELERAEEMINSMFDPTEALKKAKEDKQRIDKQLADANALMEEAERQRQEVLKRQAKDAEYLYQLFTIAYSKFEIDKAKEYITTRAELDPDMVEWQIFTGLFYLEVMGDYDTAMMYNNRALAASQKQNGEESMQTALCYNNIASSHYYKKDYQKAISNFQKALGIWEKSLGEDYDVVAIAYDNVASVYKETGNYNEAKKNLDKAFEIKKRLYGENNPSLATLYNNRGGLCEKQGDYECAAENYSKAFELYTALYGEQHPSVANIYNNIGGIYGHYNDYDHALAMFAKALEIWSTTLGDNHPDTRTALENIGEVAMLKGDEQSKKDDYAAALKSYTLARQSYVNAFGEANRKVGLAYEYMGLTNVYLKNFKEAEANFVCAIESHSKAPDGKASHIASLKETLQVIRDNMK
jgi:tetratricopeptide (TPR) repeat protein